MKSAPTFMWQCSMIPRTKELESYKASEEITSGPLPEMYTPLLVHKGSRVRPRVFISTIKVKKEAANI